jgi:hypothetical protein
MKNEMSWARVDGRDGIYDDQKLFSDWWIK